MCGREHHTGVLELRRDARVDPLPVGTKDDAADDGGIDLLAKDDALTQICGELDAD